MAELREFQLAAVERIVARLSDPAGSRRFLLADEVGLGKTLVAKGVIDELRRRKRKGGFTIVYICSNAEIADQNRTKLCDEKESAVPGRLTLLALQSQHIGRRRADGQVQVFALTPGTSLQVEHGTGIARERRLLMYLLFRVWRKRVNRAKWRRFFRCGAGSDNWERDTRFRRLRGEFLRSIAGELQTRLKAQWDAQKIQILDVETGKDAPPVLLAECIDACVDAFDMTENETTRRTLQRKKQDAIRWNRNRIVGELRKGLARVSLEFLEPDLIILDEFQRFSEILLESRDDASIVGKLFAKGSGAILILSATPYKMYTLPHEKEDHHEDFLKTLAFLRREKPGSPGLGDILNDLKGFRERLVKGTWAEADDPELRTLKERLETQLKDVMCRTERNWYLEESAKGVEEVVPEKAVPGKTELTEYVHLRRFLLEEELGDWNITDFWKSSPSVLSFMDSQYGLTKRLRRNGTVLPSNVLCQSTVLPDVASDNLKFRLLFEKIFGCGESPSDAPPWKFLWVRPSYTYYQDAFYPKMDPNDRETYPKKLLVFSHWRFVPKAVSILASHEALRRIGRFRRRLQSAPLQFRGKVAFYPFDACFPSPALAACVSPLKVALRPGQLPTDKELYAAARHEVEGLLKSSGIRKGETRTAPLWKIMARVDARSPFAGQVRDGLVTAQRGMHSEGSEHFPLYARQYLAWMDDESDLAISPTWLDRLTHIAIHSPGVCLLRAFWSAFPQSPGDTTWPAVLEFCLGPLRHYFNKRMVQTIIRRHGSGTTYTEKILSYCRQAHFQPLMDEYAHLVRHVLQEDKPRAFLEHIGRAMGMWTGAPGVNERTRRGRISRRPTQQQAHFALAFGDDVSSDSMEASGKARKSAVREAFNSPFWPFVLATTSVGQEGLDFHLYCRDIAHWNLPSNPVDLEQREGRINRYDGLSIRRNISRDFPLSAIELLDGESLWTAIFRNVAGKAHGGGRFKHGLFPHWIYQARIKDSNASSSDNAIIRRHLLFYSGSSDRGHYADLKSALSLYRLVFGQPRQQDILDQVLARDPNRSPKDLDRSLAKYMINLSPFGPGHAIRRAEREARRLLGRPEELGRVMAELPEYLARVPGSVRTAVDGKLANLASLVATGDPAGIEEDPLRRESALAAILYLLDPYDAVYDLHGAVGFSDDADFIRVTHARLFSSPTPADSAPTPAP